LRELATKLTEQSTDVESWIICKEDDDSDTLWAFEFCKDDETLALYESNQDVEKSHEAIIELGGIHVTGAAQVSALPPESAREGWIPA
jgi:hypothetical protein